MELLDRAPRGVFRGNNFVTPRILGYVRCRVHEKRAWAELSSGSGIFDPKSTLYGVTFRRPDGSELWCEEDGDPSGCFASRREALDHIAEYATA